MLPDVRLMIAATFASVVVLICGFAVFAAFRVSYEPLVRVPAAAAQLQLVAANAATPATNVALAEPFDDRFQIRQPGGGSDVSALAYSAPLPAEQSAIAVATPTADDHEHDAAEAEPASVAPDTADAAAPSPQAALPEAAQETKPAEATEATAAHEAVPSPPSIATVAALNSESPAEQPLPAAQTIESETATAPLTIEPVGAKPATAAKPAQKDTKHPHVAARTHRSRKASAVAQDFLEQPKSDTAPTRPSHVAQRQPAKSRRAKIAPGTGETISGAGGPFVSAPSR
jgi:hypothetical protein